MTTTDINYEAWDSKGRVLKDADHPVALENKFIDAFRDGEEHEPDIAQIRVWDDGEERFWPPAMVHNFILRLRAACDYARHDRDGMTESKAAAGY